MKVISRGILPESIIYTTSCRKCHSVLEFKKSDARIVNDRNDMCYVLKCPVCSGEIWISSTALRPVVQSTDFRDQPYEPK